MKGRVHTQMDSKTRNADNSSVVFSVEKDVVATNSGELRELLRGLVAGGARAVELDFSKVGMIDSSGLGMIMAANFSLRKLDGALSLTHCSEDILELFQSMRVDQQMSISGTKAAKKSEGTSR